MVNMYSFKKALVERGVTMRLYVVTTIESPHGRKLGL